MHLPKNSRYTLGEKIDRTFIETIEAIFIASYVPKEQKILYLKRAAGKFDLLKLFLQIAWEMQVIETKKYVLLSEKLDEIGKMLGGWLRKASSAEHSL